MKGIHHHINHIRQQAHHIRRRASFIVAGITTALVALVWVASSISTGSFTIHSTSFAQTTGSEIYTPSAGLQNTSQLAGSAAALQSTETSARIEIIGATTSTTAMATSTAQTQGTIIPF